MPLDQRSSPEPGAATAQPRLGRGLANRYLAYVLSALLVVLFGFSGVVVWHQLAREKSDLAADATAQADFLGAVAPEAVFFRDYLALETLVRQTTEDPDVVYVVVVDTEGRSMTRYVDRANPIVADALARADDNDAQTMADIAHESSAVKEVRLPIVSEGVLLGDIRLGYSIASARQRATDFAVQALVAMVLLGLVLAAITALVFEWQIRRPLRQLFVGANALAAGNLAERVQVERSDEIGTVHSAFNVMADELERTVATARFAQEAAEDAARAKSEFLANMSHEIRTPLNAVLGLTEVVLGTELSDEQEKLLQTVRRSGTSLLGIINDILYLSKIEAGRLDLEAEPFSIRRCLDDVRDLFAVEAERKGLRLEFVVDDSVTDSVSGDESRLRQILVNLVGNAVKFTDEGEIEVLVRPPSSPGVGNDGTEFLVRDTGVGIASGALELLFEPFSQADASTTRRYGGTGLGLTICRRLVDLMGGDLTVESVVGQGSSFSFIVTLPSLDTFRAPPLDDNERSADQSNTFKTHRWNNPDASPDALRVLLVEDNIVNQTVALEMLKRLNQKADLANNGVEAVEMAAANTYDLILMDIQMPELDGVEAMHQIRDQHVGGRGPRIIALTANAVEGDREHYINVGMDGYLAKPFRLSDLLEAIDRTRSSDSAYLRNSVQIR